MTKKTSIIGIVLILTFIISLVAVKNRPSQTEALQSIDSVTHKQAVSLPIPKNHPIKAEWGYRNNATELSIDDYIEAIIDKKITESLVWISDCKKTDEAIVILYLGKKKDEPVYAQDRVLIPEPTINVPNDLSGDFTLKEAIIDPTSNNVRFMYRYEPTLAESLLN